MTYTKQLALALFVSTIVGALFAAHQSTAQPDPSAFNSKSQDNQWRELMNHVTMALERCAMHTRTVRDSNEPIDELFLNSCLDTLNRARAERMSYMLEAATTEHCSRNDDEPQLLDLLNEIERLGENTLNEVNGIGRPRGYGLAAQYFDAQAGESILEAESIIALMQHRRRMCDMSDPMTEIPRIADWDSQQSVPTEFRFIEDIDIQASTVVSLAAQMRDATHRRRIRLSADTPRPEDQSAQDILVARGRIAYLESERTRLGEERDRILRDLGTDRPESMVQRCERLAQDLQMISNGVDMENDLIVETSQSLNELPLSQQSSEYGLELLYEIQDHQEQHRAEDALYDDYTQLCEQIIALATRADDISSELDRYDVETASARLVLARTPHNHSRSDREYEYRTVYPLRTLAEEFRGLEDTLRQFRETVRQTSAGS